jgi:hypothetical protein
MLAILDNERPTWLALLRADLDRAAWNADGWEDEEQGAVAEDAMLERLWALNAERGSAR